MRRNLSIERVLRKIQKLPVYLQSLVAICTLAVSANAVVADDILLRVNTSHLDYAATVALAELGLPTKAKILGSELLGEVITRRCGRRDEHYLRLLQDRASDYPMIALPMTFESEIKGDHDVELPFCLTVPDKHLFKLSSPESIKLASNPPGTLWPYSVSGGKFSGVLIGDVPFGDKPFSGMSSIEVWPTIGMKREYEGWAGIPLRAGRTPAEALSKLLASIQTGQQKAPIGALVERGIKVVSVPSSSDDKCPEQSRSDEKYPFDSMGFLRVLGLNHANGKMWYGDTQIILVDTGLSEKAARTTRNALVDLGSRTDSERTPTTDYPLWNHGSYVASAALGGAYFSRFSALMNNPVRLRPVNIVEAKDGTLASKRLLTVLELGRNDKAVINLSISYHREIDGLKTVLDQQRNALFVAAAGNSPGPVTYEHPAALGGQYQNLIVVTALNQNGEFETKQSTWSEAHVELAAYGCRIPVLEEGAEKAVVVYRSGTSLAAPLVSFAAAVLNKYNIGGPAEVKVRLLASADYDPKLQGKVKRNLKLNVVRAVAIGSDVIETNSKADAPIYGRIVRGANLLLLCEGHYSMGRGTRTSPGPGNRSLLSLDVFQEKGISHVFFLYQIGQTNNLESHTCTLDSKLADHELEIAQQDGDIRTIRIGDLRKLLFAID